MVWIGNADRRLPGRVRDTILDPQILLFVSAVTAWEFVDLENRGRLPTGVSLAPILDRLDATTLDFPAKAWTLAKSLPNIHLDPVDRMLVAHAILADITLVTADARVRDYPVRTFW